MDAEAIEEVRRELTRRTSGQRGALARLSRAAGWSGGTLCMFRRGNYHGNISLVARTLAGEFVKDGWNPPDGLDSGLREMPCVRDGESPDMGPMVVNPVSIAAERVNRYLEGAAKGAAARLAREAGISPGTLSKFRKGMYCGKSEQVAARLAEALKSREIASGIMDGRLMPSWLVNTKDGLLTAATREVRDQLMKEHPSACVVQVWRGKDPEEIEFVRVGGL